MPARWDEKTGTFMWTCERCPAVLRANTSQEILHLGDIHNSGHDMLDKLSNSGEYMPPHQLRNLLAATYEPPPNRASTARYDKLTLTQFDRDLLAGLKISVGE